MSKLKLTTLKEDEDFNNEEVEIKDEIVTPIEDNDVDEEGDSFIDSNELNEIRDILLDIPDDIELLLLNDNLITLGQVIDQDTFLYTLPEESEDFILIKLPLKFEEIQQNNDIIKYEPNKVYDNHQKVVDLLMKKLTPDREEESTNEED